MVLETFHEMFDNITIKKIQYFVSVNLKLFRDSTF